MKLKKLNQNDFQMPILQDLGMVQKENGKRERRAIFKCVKCGDPTEKLVSNVKGKNTKFCSSCSRQETVRNFKELDPNDYKLELIKDLGRIVTVSGGSKARYAIFRCSCGNEEKLHAYATTTKNREFCNDCNSRGTSHKLYSIWNGIYQRCYNTKRKDYKNYGAKGVQMYEPWKNNPKAFIDWCIKNGWKDGLNIDKDIKSEQLGIIPHQYTPETISFISARENIIESQGKKVYQYSLDKVLLNTFACSTNAYDYLNKSRKSSGIQKCCRNEQKTAFGYIWSYKPL